MVNLDREHRLSSKNHILTAIAVSILAGLLEWAKDGALGYNLSQADSSRVLLSIIVVYGLFGLIAGFFSAKFSRKFGVDVVSVALVPAVLVTLAVSRFPSVSRSSVLELAAGLALGWITYFAISAAGAKFATLRQPRIWWVAVGFLLVFVSGIGASNSLDFSGAIIALGAASICLSLSLWELILIGNQGASVRPKKTMLGCFLIFVISSVLAFRIPVIEPNVQSDINLSSVLLVTIDTLRADHVGAYGYTNARTPNLDALAKEGVLFRETVAPTKLTGPSHTSILTGLLPDKHGVFLNSIRIPESVPTLAEIFKDNGYVTAAFVSSYTTRDGASGLPSRFQYYDDESNPNPIIVRRVFVRLLLLRSVLKSLQYFGFEFDQAYRGAADTTDVAVNWIERNGNRPFFLWTHFFDPHLPYRPPNNFLTHSDREYDGPVSGRWYALDATERADLISSTESMSRMIALYDAEVAYSDNQLGRLVKAVRDTKVGADALIVVTSDHGESHGEHGIFFARDLYDPTLLVPLIMVVPDLGIQPGREVVEQVRLIDIAPTILGALGLEVPNSFDGQSVLNLMRKAGAMSPGPAFSFSNIRAEDFRRRHVSIRTEGWKLIHRSAGWRGGAGSPWVPEHNELYYLLEDPDETNNIAASSLNRLHELEKELKHYKNQSNSLELELTDDELERLRSLGYFR